MISWSASCLSHTLSLSLLPCVAMHEYNIMGASKDESGAENTARMWTCIEHLVRPRMELLCVGPEDLPKAMNDREEWRERVRDIRATSAT